MKRRSVNFLVGERMANDVPWSPAGVRVKVYLGYNKGKQYPERSTKRGGKSRQPNTSSVPLEGDIGPTSRPEGEPQQLPG
jgi:hypothetical protein